MKQRLIIAVLLASFAVYVAVVNAGDDSNDADDTAAAPPPSVDGDDSEKSTLAPAEDGTEEPKDGDSAEETTKKPKKKDERKKGGKKGKGKKKKKDDDDSSDSEEDVEGDLSKPANDSLILGSYRLASDPKAKDLNEFLKAMEYSKRDRNRIRNAYMVNVRIEKKEDDEEEYSYRVHLGWRTIKETFTLGEEYDTKLFDGREYKATVTMASNVVTRTEQHDGFEANHKAIFTKKGFTIEMTAKNKTAKQKYRRQANFFQSLKNGFDAFFKG